MTVLTVELPDELYQRLQATATRQGTSAEAIAQQWLHERLTREPVSEHELATELLRQAGLLEKRHTEEEQAAQSTATLDEIRATLQRAGKPSSERELATEVLRQAGLLAELTPAEQARGAQCTVTLDEVRAALGRNGRPLSEIILEQRGPKV